jgi:hypothetical protein
MDVESLLSAIAVEVVRMFVTLLLVYLVHMLFLTVK